jgi:subtilisin family serine protease
VVAAAGNDSSSSPFWPAAFEWVTGVGSVDANGHLSDFSNYGDWVNVYARGRDLVNAFPSGTYTCYEPQNIHNGVPDVRHFSSLAQWSGTSFSTPVVTGLIAAAKTPTNTIVDAHKAVMDSATVIDGRKVVGPLT